jgi:hypothetical protein
VVVKAINEAFREKEAIMPLLDKITVYDDHFIVEFKSRIEIQIN